MVRKKWELVVSYEATGSVNPSFVGLQASMYQIRNKHPIFGVMMKLRKP